MGYLQGYEQFDRLLYRSDAVDIAPRVDFLVRGTTQCQDPGKKVSESRHVTPHVHVSIGGGTIGNSRCQLLRAWFLNCLAASACFVLLSGRTPSTGDQWHEGSCRIDARSERNCRNQMHLLEIQRITHSSPRHANRLATTSSVESQQSTGCGRSTWPFSSSLERDQE